MKITVAYAGPVGQSWLKLDLGEGTTVGRALEVSGLLERHPEIDLTVNRVGIFGKFAKLDDTLREGARVEVYRPITADPETVPRRDPDDDD